jgi:hypothetical protein
MRSTRFIGKRKTTNKKLKTRTRIKIFIRWKRVKLMTFDRYGVPKNPTIKQVMANNDNVRCQNSKPAIIDIQEECDDHLLAIIAIFKLGE